MEGGHHLGDGLARVGAEALVGGGDSELDHPGAPAHVAEVEDPDHPLRVVGVDHDVVLGEVPVYRLFCESPQARDDLSLVVGQCLFQGGPALR